MRKNDTATEQLKTLLETYGVPWDTLCKYLSLNKAQLKELLAGNMEALPPNIRFGVYEKIGFLLLSAQEDKDLKLEAFLDVLHAYHHLPAETIAKMAGVKKEDVTSILSRSGETVSKDAKYKIAVTVMALRFFLKECEPKE